MTFRRANAAFLANVAAPVLIAILGTTILWTETDGARAFTTEAARRLAVLRKPVAPAPARLQASNGEPFTLDSLKERTLVVNFIYTHCATVCLGLGTTLERLQIELDREGHKDIRLLSIGFDTERDTPRALAAYGERHRADPRWWTLARVTATRDLQPLLASFGVVVLADRYGGFTHNAALHIVDSKRGIVRILDSDDVEGTLAFIRTRPNP